MSLEDKKKWDEKYAAGAFATRTYPSIYLNEKLGEIKSNLESRGITPPWRALDIACGAGRNAHYLALNDFEVDAIDISETALDRAAAARPATSLNINWRQHDLEGGLPKELSGYHLIIMMRYVNLPLLATLESRLLENGYLLCEEHLQTQAQVFGPKSANFRVAPGDLRGHAGNLLIDDLSEGLLTDPDGETACVARILGRKGVRPDV